MKTPLDLVDEAIAFWADDRDLTVEQARERQGGYPEFQALFSLREKIAGLEPARVERPSPTLETTTGTPPRDSARGVADALALHFGGQLRQTATLEDGRTFVRTVGADGTIHSPFREVGRLPTVVGRTRWSISFDFNPPRPLTPDEMERMERAVVATANEFLRGLTPPSEEPKA